MMVGSSEVDELDRGEVDGFELDGCGPAAVEVVGSEPLRESLVSPEETVKGIAGIFSRDSEPSECFVKTSTSLVGNPLGVAMAR